MRETRALRGRFSLLDNLTRNSTCISMPTGPLSIGDFSFSAFFETKFSTSQYAYVAIFFTLGLQRGPEAGSFTLVSPGFGPTLQSQRPKLPLTFNHTRGKCRLLSYPLHQWRRNCMCFRHSDGIRPVFSTTHSFVVLR